jgi:hypothetical protein
MELMTRRAQRRDPTRDGESPRVGLTLKIRTERNRGETADPSERTGA